ncbi:hypothetical protein SDJN02_23837, partial [Cucurbita argyrosperma subsp. argyrosperma]
LHFISPSPLPLSLSLSLSRKSVMADHQSDGEQNSFPFRQNQEATAGSGNRYGGLAPKKKPLISKQGAGLCNSVAVEKLQPKLQRTPKPRLPPRRPVCTSEKGNIVE